jgi:hypothetical protein
LGENEGFWFNVSQTIVVTSSLRNIWTADAMQVQCFPDCSGDKQSEKHLDSRYNAGTMFHRLVATSSMRNIRTDFADSVMF